MLQTFFKLPKKSCYIKRIKKENVYLGQGQQILISTIVIQFATICDFNDFSLKTDLIRAYSYLCLFEQIEFAEKKLNHDSLEKI